MKRPIGRPRINRRCGRGGGRWLAALGAVAAMGLVTSPVAEASRPHSLHGMVTHLRSADRATARLTGQPAGPLAAMYLARTVQQTELADQIARSIAGAARGGASSERAATALGLLADHQTAEAQALSSVLGDVAPSIQGAVARAISTATGGRGAVLGKLSGLLGSFSASSQPVVAQVVALEASQGAQVPVALAGVLGASGLACSATGAVQQALVVATQAFQVGLSNLGPALALVSGPVHQQVQSEIDGIPDLLRHIEEQLAQAVPCAGSPAGAGAVSTPVKAIQAPALLGGMTEFIDGILGHVLPGLAAGGPAPAPLAAPLPLAGLLGGHGLFGVL